MAVVCLGYLSGIIHKALYSFDAITALYALNMVMVAFDLFLYYRYEQATPRGAWTLPGPPA
jgi:hypothetical protein